MTKTKLTPTDYHSMVNLLNSTDKENTTVVLSILENLDFTANLPYILLLLKRMNRQEREKIDEYSNLWKNLNNIGIQTSNPIRMALIFQKIKHHVDREAVEFVMNEGFINDVLKHLQDWGFDFIDEVDITLKLRE